MGACEISLPGGQTAIVIGAWLGVMEVRWLAGAWGR